MAQSDSSGIDRVKAKESNTQAQGRGVSAYPRKLDGPVRSTTSNPTSGGGINRATKKG